MDKSKRTVKLSKIDANASEQIRQTIEEIRKDGKLPGEIEIVLQDTSGEIESAVELIQELHASDEIDLVTNSKGKIDRAGTLIAAAGKPGSRSADRSATFELLVGATYPSNVDLTTLREEDALFVEVLQKLTGRPKAILDAITKMKQINAASAQRLKIIDIRPVFQNKYAVKRKRQS